MSVCRKTLCGQELVRGQNLPLQPPPRAAPRLLFRRSVALVLGEGVRAPQDLDQAPPQPAARWLQHRLGAPAPSTASSHRRRPSWELRSPICPPPSPAQSPRRIHHLFMPFTFVTNKSFSYLLYASVWLLLRRRRGAAPLQLVPGHAGAAWGGGAGKGCTPLPSAAPATAPGAGSSPNSAVPFAAALSQVARLCTPVQPRCWGRGRSDGQRLRDLGGALSTPRQKSDRH